jgi:hypothetical protein
MPWKCPDCQTWLAPDVKEHRCGDGPAAAPVAWPLNPQPFSPSFYMAPPWTHCPGCHIWFVGYHACWTYTPWTQPIGTTTTGGYIISSTPTLAGNSVGGSKTYFVT